MIDNFAATSLIGLDVFNTSATAAARNSGVYFIPEPITYSSRNIRPNHREIHASLQTDLRLFVGGRDRTKSVDGLQWQVDAVRAVLDDDDVPVHPALSFVGAEWPLLFAKPFQLKGVWISWPGKLAELVLGEGPLSIEEVDRLARLLSQRLPAN